jgi:valyl-tRNA synthetase
VFQSGTAQVYLIGLIDLAAEQARIAKERDRVVQERERITGKLANEAFVSRAPADVVAGERARLAELENTLAQLDEQYRQLDATAS